MPDRTPAQRRRRDLILYSCMIICSVLAAVSAAASVRFFTEELRRQEHATCVANRAFLKLLNQSMGRQQRSLKVDPPKKKPIDRAAIRDIQTLIDGYGPAVEFCPEKT